VTLAQHLGKFDLRMMAIARASLTLKMIRRRFQAPHQGVQQVSVTRKLGQASSGEVSIDAAGADNEWSYRA
jgi:hypothetical protein